MRTTRRRSEAQASVGQAAAPGRRDEIFEEEPETVIPSPA